MNQPAFRLERATERDLALILRFIKELGAYEQLSHEVTVTEQELRESLFGAQPAAEVVVAYAGDEPAGFAVYFHTFSTFLGRRRVLAYVARVAVERDCGRLEWSVLNWNDLALGVYRKIGARPMNEWTVQRL